MLKRFCAIAIFIAFASGQVSASDKNPEDRLDDVDAFVHSLSSEALDILGNTSTSRNERQSQFENFVDEKFDMRGIGKFVLGKYWSKANPSQQTKYLRLFSKSMVYTYFDLLEEYANRTLTVKSSRVKKTRNGHYFIVRSEITENDVNKPPVAVDWRVFPVEDGFKVIDVVIEGVSTAITQRAEYSSVIQNNGGSVQGLIDALDNRVSRLSSSS